MENTLSRTLDRVFVCLFVSAIAAMLFACSTTSDSGATSDSGDITQSQEEAVSENEGSPSDTEDTGESKTLVVDGVTYELLYTVVCEDSLELTDPQFDEYFDGSAEEGVAAITKAGNVYINGQRIPYTLEDGTASTDVFYINGEERIWQVDGGWAWKAHLQRSWDDTFYMPDIEEGFEAGTPVDLETATYLFAKHMTHMVGQTVDLWAEEGADTASVITTTYYNSTIVSAVENNNGVVRFYMVSGDDLGYDFPEENVEDGIAAEDMIIYWEDGEAGWSAKRAVATVGYLVENADNIKEPFFRAEGSEELITTGDSYVDKNFDEQFRHTQFIRGERRTDQYSIEVPVIMWSSDELPDHVLGFTRGESAYESLVHAVEYAKEVTQNILISEDGSDVAQEDQWVTPEIWDEFEAQLEECEAVIESGDYDNFSCDLLIYELGNVLGGTEDLNSDSPMKMNPLGVVGSVAFGTMGL